MSFPKLEEKREELAAKQKDLHGIFSEAGPDMDLSQVKSLSGDSHDKVEEIRRRNEEIDALAKEVENLEFVNGVAEKAMQFDPDGKRGAEPGGAEPGETLDFTQKLFRSQAFTSKGTTSTVQLPESAAQLRPARDMFNTLFQTTDGWAPESTRSGRIDLSPEEEPGVTDLVPAVQWGQELYKFMRETTFTNASSERAEGAEFPEASLKVEEQSEEIRKLPVWIPLTDEQLEDVPGSRAYVESRLRFMLEQKLDQRILTGDPSETPAQIRGFHNTANINTQALGSDPVPDAVHKAITAIRTAGQARATGVVFHPENWEEVRLLRTSDGIYIWGNPSEAGPARIWGLPVVQSTHETKGQALVGAFREHSLLAVRRDVDVQVSNSHSDFFINGKQAMRADIRVALVTIRPQAFTEVTGLSA